MLLLQTGGNILNEALVTLQVMERVERELHEASANHKQCQSINQSIMGLVHSAYDLLRVVHFSIVTAQWRP